MKDSREGEMNKEELSRLLSKVGTFSGLNAADLQAVLDSCLLQTFGTGDVLVQERQPVSAFHILVEGEVKVLLPETIAGTKQHRVTDIPLSNLGPGDCFGEYGLIDGQPASASVIALRPGSVLKLGRDEFDQLLETNDRMAKTIYRNLLRQLIGRLRKREQEYDLVLVEC